MSDVPLTGYEELDSALAAAIDAACERFEGDWRSGRRPALEAYLDTSAGPEQGVLLRELILLEVAYRRRCGERPRAEEYRGRFPQLSGTWLGEALLAPTAVTPTLPATPRRDAAPVGVSGYQIVAELGRGGMGAVYKARDARLGRFVALKFLTPQAARDPRRLERFRREARAASALNHPAICTLHGMGEHENRPFLILEWVEGQTLRTLLDGGPELTRVLPLVRQAAEALSAAHAAGIVHRDVKPENLMVRADGYLKVLDFGLARLLEQTDGAATDPGVVMGTVGYMSPEQARGEPAGSPSDIFSLGIVLYELATGRHPFEAAGAFSPLRAITAEPALLPSRLNPEIPAPVEALILRMLDKDAKRRPTAAEVASALAEDRGSRIEDRGSRRWDCDPRPSHVGREAERDVLRSALESAAGWRGLVVCVSGEPGIGKTTLVEDFLTQASGGRSCWVARGRCSERLAGTEAYLPVLEAIDGLVRGEAGAVAARALRLLAPTWHALAAPAGMPHPAREQATTPAGSPERLKRELLALVEGVTRERPLVLFLDDVHWADASTVDLLAYLGPRCAGLRLLVVLTYRPTEMLLSEHPFLAMQLDLQREGCCRELALGFLGRAEVDRYLALAFPGHRFPPEFAEVIHARTEGSPLFLVALLAHLREQGAITGAGGSWSLAGDVPELQEGLPASVRSMIRRKIELLDAADRRLLSVGSVQGQEFDSAAAARVLRLDPAEVEERLEVLDRVHGLVRLVREQELPDGTLTLRYRFVHILYQNTLHAALPPSRRAAWSGAVAGALLLHHGGQGAAIAGELALLFEAARDPAAAVEYFLLAAGNAVRRFAHREAAALAQRGLALAQRLPDTAARARRELPLLTALGVSLVATRGFAAPEVEAAYERALALCGDKEDIQTIFPVLYGLWNLYLVRCELARSEGMARQMFELARARGERDYLLLAHNVLHQPLFHEGEFAAARRHQEEGWAFYDADRHRGLTDVYGEDAGVGLLAFGAVTLWYLGYPEQALRSAEAGQALAERLSAPFNVARALYFSAFTHLCRREPERVGALAAALMALSEEQGFTMLLAGARVLRGWSEAAQGRVEEGIRQMRQGLAGWEAAGARSHRPTYLALLAEALAKAGRAETGLGALAEALQLTAATGERFHEAELHRLRGELLGGQAAAESAFREALAVARRQGAKSPELRAAVSLARWLRDQGRGAEGRQLLREVHGWFTEGRDTPDQQDAAGILARPD